MEDQKKDYAAHVLAIPWPAPGHMNPMMQLCKRLVHRGGIKATFAITKFQSKSMQSKLDYIQVDTISDGYDEGGSFIIDSFQESVERFRDAGSETLAELIKKHESLGQPFDCIIYDAFVPWALVVAKKFCIAGAAFFTQTCAVNFINHHVYHKLIPYPFTSPPFSLPGLPLLGLEDMPGFIQVDPYIYTLVLGQFSTPEKADYRLVNTFYELEPEAVDSMSKIHSLRTIGPTIPAFYLDNRIENDKGYGLHATHLMFQEKDSSHTDPATVLDWLNTKPARSVVYVSFGSVAIASPVAKEMEEIAWALKNSKCYFLWVVKPNEEPNLPKNFAQETAKKGLIVSWSPQLEVLAHEAVGCFITHCGWNSTIEAMCLGVPMVAMPKWADQPTNSKYIQDVWKVGVRVKVDKDGLAGREDIERCIKTVMEGKSGKEIKKNAIKWKEICKAALSEGGSSDKNIDEFASELIASSSVAKVVRSSSEGVDDCDMRFQTRFCDCGHKVQIKIMENNDKSTSGKLYYCCPYNSCRVWGWLKPSSVKRMNSDGRSYIEDKSARCSDIEVSGEERGKIELLEMVYDLKQQLQATENGLKSRIQLLETMFGLIKVLVMASGV